jgi:predicted nucleic acid-binding protein
MLVLLDTNILLRLFERADPNYRDIRAVLTLSWGRGDELVTTPQNVIEYWNVSTRPVTARGGYGRSVAKTRARLAGIQRVCRMLAETDETFEEWKRTVIAHSIVGVSVHDARIVAQMAIANVRSIVTLNPSDFRRYPGITVMTPQDVLATVP